MFSADLLSALTSAQSSAPSAASSTAPGPASQLIGALDTDGDGKLSASELDSGLQALAPQRHHGRHHHGPPPTDAAATDLADTDGSAVASAGAAATTAAASAPPVTAASLEQTLQSFISQLQQYQSASLSRFAADATQSLNLTA